MSSFLELLKLMVQNNSNLQDLTWEKLLLKFLWNVNKLKGLLAVLEENSDSLELREKIAMQDYINIHDW
jgi:hypothetical protein